MARIFLDTPRRRPAAVTDHFLHVIMKLSDDYWAIRQKTFAPPLEWILVRPGVVAQVLAIAQSHERNAVGVPMAPEEQSQLLSAVERSALQWLRGHRLATPSDRVCPVVVMAEQRGRAKSVMPMANGVVLTDPGGLQTFLDEYRVDATGAISMSEESLRRALGSARLAEQFPRAKRGKMRVDEVGHEEQALVTRRAVVPWRGVAATAGLAALLLGLVTLQLGLARAIEPPLWLGSAMNVVGLQPVSEVMPCEPSQPPSFRKIFSELHQELGDLMGEPAGCEYLEASSGDIHQVTTRGLVYLRRSLNVVVFTDGDSHWALLPRGLATWTGPEIEPPPQARLIRKF